MLINSRNISLALTLAAVALTPAAALADHGADDGGGGDDGKREATRVAGNCSGSSSAKLKAKHDDGRLETEFEVDQNRNSVRWAVRIRRNGKRVVRTRATTTAPSGSFSVERKIADPAGSDRITAKATSPSGEVCRASLTM
jgi:hypothetical protein